jgi:hypothetical protein
MQRRYYSPAAYALTKVVLDGLLLRALPALLFALPFYFLMGLNPAALQVGWYGVCALLSVCCYKREQFSTIFVNSVCAYALTKLVLDGLLLRALPALLFALLFYFLMGRNPAALQVGEE